jgi:hypothetical protein
MSDSLGMVLDGNASRRDGFLRLDFSPLVKQSSSSPSVSVISDSNPDALTRSSEVVKLDVEEMVLSELALLALEA